METLYIKLKNGTDIVSNTSIEENSLVLSNPMALRTYSDNSGRMSLALQDWVPLDFVDTDQFTIDRNEVLIITAISVRMKEFYIDCLRKPENDKASDQEEEVTDQYSQIIKALGNKRLLH
jgi:hypothetical protein